MRRLLSLVGVLVVVAGAGMSAVHAQPSPPTRFFGATTLDDQPAPDGTTITAFVGTNNCGTGTITGSSYTVDVASATTKSGCGTDGATVGFTIGSAMASQTGTFQPGALVSLDLIASSQLPRPPCPPVTTAPASLPLVVGASSSQTIPLLGTACPPILAGAVSSQVPSAATPVIGPIIVVVGPWTCYFVIIDGWFWFICLVT